MEILILIVVFIIVFIYSNKNEPFTAIPPPPQLAGGKCSMNADCKGYILGSNTLLCDNLKCAQALVDFRGQYVAPSKCVDVKGGKAGTCKAGTRVVTAAPIYKRGETCTRNEECDGYIANRDTLICDNKPETPGVKYCTGQKKDWWGNFVAPSQCKKTMWSSLGSC